MTCNSIRLDEVAQFVSYKFEGLVDKIRLLRKLPSNDANLSWNNALDSVSVLLDAKEQKEKKNYCSDCLKPIPLDEIRCKACKELKKETEP